MLLIHICVSYRILYEWMLHQQGAVLSSYSSLICVSSHFPSHYSPLQKHVVCPFDDFWSKRSCKSFDGRHTFLHAQHRHPFFSPLKCQTLTEEKQQATQTPSSKWQDDKQRLKLTWTVNVMPRQRRLWNNLRKNTKTAGWNENLKMALFGLFVQLGIYFLFIFLQQNKAFLKPHFQKAVQYILLGYWSSCFHYLN